MKIFFYRLKASLLHIVSNWMFTTTDDIFPLVALKKIIPFNKVGCVFSWLRRITRMNN